MLGVCRNAMALVFLHQQPASSETHPHASGSYASMMPGINRATLVASFKT